MKEKISKIKSASNVLENKKTIKKGIYSNKPHLEKKENKVKINKKDNKDK